MIEDAELVERAVRAARPHSNGSWPRWVAVRDAFACGSTVAHELCLRFGFDPGETVRGIGEGPIDGEPDPNDLAFRDLAASGGTVDAMEAADATPPHEAEAPLEIRGYVNMPSYDPGEPEPTPGERIIGIRIKQPEWPNVSGLPAPMHWLKSLVENHQRTQRAEAENARLRDALNDHHQWARTQGHDMGLGYLNSWLDIKTRKALATPPPESERGSARVEGGVVVAYPDNKDAPHTPEQTSYCPRCTQEMDLYSVTHCPSCDVSVGGPPPSEQAHGDALAALVDEIAPPIPPFNSEAEEEEYHCEAAVRHYSERVREKLRRHLTASGVPYVPEHIRALPDHWQDRVREDMTAQDCADELERALASAPAVRDWLALLEREDWGLVPISVPIGGDDYDVEWTVVQYHMAEPKERVIGRGPTPREALSDAAPF